MADLIYRDVAKFQACNWSVEHNEAIYDEIKEAIKRLLNLAPAVDAIPVEWREERKRWASADGDNECVGVIEYLIDRWQKEQEAR